MHLAKILTLLPTLGLALVVPRKAAPPWPLTDPGGYTIEDFPFLDFTERTALDPYIHLGKPDFGYPRVFKCLPFEEGDADPVGCSYVITKWEDMGNSDGNIFVKGGQCKAITQRCCQGTVCAPKKIDIVMTPRELTDLLWFKFSDKCVIQYQGGIFMDDGWDYLVTMGRPPRCQAKVYRPESERKSLVNESFWES